jgi:hypothetical protein
MLVKSELFREGALGGPHEMDTGSHGSRKYDLLLPICFC